MTNGINDVPATQPAIGATAGASRDNRTAIPVSCALHRGPRGFANLVVERKRDGEIVLDKTAAMALFDILGRWLR